MDPNMKNDIEQITDLFNDVMSKAKEEGIEVFLFARKNQCNSITSNIRDVEDAGRSLAQCTGRVLLDEEAPKTASSFADTLLVAAAQLSKALERTADDIFNTIINGKR